MLTATTEVTCNIGYSGYRNSFLIQASIIVLHTHLYQSVCFWCITK